MHGGLHHLHTRHRRREGGRGSPYPHPQRWKRRLDRVMYFVAIITPLFLLPQVYDLYITQDASGMSLITWVLLLSTKGLWVFYGVAHRAWPILVSNIIFTIIDIAIIAGIVMYA